MNKIQKLTQTIRDNAECQLDYGTIRTLKMIDDVSQSTTHDAVLCEVESLKTENLLLHKLLDNINCIVYNHLMVKDNINVDEARKKILNELEKWASI